MTNHEAFEAVHLLEVEDRIRRETESPLEAGEWIGQLTKIANASEYKNIDTLWRAYCNYYCLSVASGNVIDDQHPYPVKEIA